MLGSSNNTFYKNIKELKTIRKNIRVLLYIKERKTGCKYHFFTKGDIEK